MVLLLCLVAPFLIMWWMVVAQRRTRALTRGVRKEEAPLVHAYVDEARDENGLSYGRPFRTNDEAFGEDPRAGEPKGIKAIEGRN
ncbi:MAG: hypothetical protein AB7O91_11980 [Sphingomonas sp.]